MSEKKIVELWSVGDIANPDAGVRELRLFEGRAIETAKVYKAVDANRIAIDSGYDANNAFGYRSTITKAEREEMRVGLTKKEALDLAFAYWVREKDLALKEVNAAEAMMTKLLKLELKVEKESE